jgi:hypothetical protein
MCVSYILLKRNVNFYVNFNTLFISLLIRKLQKGGGAKFLKPMGCVYFYISKVVANSHLILFYSEKRRITTYGYATNWNNTGYFEAYHSVRTYRVKYLPKITMVSPGQCND